MTCVWQQKADTLVDAAGAFDADKARAAFSHGNGIGQVGRPSDAGGGLDARDTARLTNAIQKFFIDESRLGVPVIFHEECLHGHAARDATSFPQPIGLAATFDPDARGIAVHHDGRRSARARDAPGVDASRRRGARSALGTRRRDLWRGPVSRLAHGRRRRARLSRRRDLPRSDARPRHAQALRRTRTAGSRDELRAGERLHARASRGLSAVVPRRHPGGRRGQRHGVVQRSRRRTVARQSVASANRAARRMALDWFRRVRLLRDLRDELSAGDARALRGARQARSVRAGGPRGRQYRTAGAGLLSTSRRSRSRRHTGRVRARRAGRAHAALEIQARLVRRSICRPRRCRGTRGS